MAFYQGFLIRTEQSAWYGAQPYHLHVTGTLHATLSTEVERDKAHLQQFGLKFGLRVGDAQQVEELIVAGTRFEESTEVSNDLTAVFGAPRGDRWAGFVTGKPLPAKYPVGNVVQLPVSLRLTEVRQLPQFVPVVVRYNNEFSFAASFLHGLWFLPAPPAKVA